MAGPRAGGNQLLDRRGRVAGQKRHLLGHRIGGAGVLGQPTFKDELADPASLNLRFIPAAKASTPDSTSTSARCTTTTSAG
jgi:hypothetical protein